MIIIDSITTNDFIFFASLIALAVVLDLFCKPPHTKGMAKNWANIVAAAIPLVLGAVQAGMASRQRKQRPIMDIPSAQKEALENQRRLAAMEKAPGTDAMLNQIRQQGAAATQNIKEITGGTAGAAGAVSDIYAKELEALQGMQGRQQEFRLGQQQALNQALNQYGQAQQGVWDYNVNQPYQQSMAAKSALTNAAMSNILGGVTGALGTYGAQQQNKEMMDFYKNLYNKNQQIQPGASTAAPAVNNLNWSQMMGSDIPNYQQPNQFPLIQANPWYQPVNPQ
jgi:hypothetical protein